MEDLLNVLQALIEKYQIEDADVAAIQEAIDKAVGTSAEEFVYTEEPEQM